MRSRAVLLLVSVSTATACTLLYAEDTENAAGGVPTEAGAASDSASAVENDASDGAAVADDASDGAATDEGCGEPGLVLRLRFDEGSGLIIRDCSSTRATGVLRNAQWTEGVSGNAVALDAGWVSVGDPEPLRLSHAFTATAWVYCASFPVDDLAVNYVVGKTSDPAASGWRLGVGPTRRPAISVIGPVDGGKNKRVDVSGGDIPARTWTHIVATYGPGTMKLYVNGEEVATSTNVPSSILDATAEVRIGSRGDGTNFFDGAIDDVRIYDRVLSIEEIASLAQH